MTIEIEEGQRQIMLLALHKLGLERSGWLIYAIPEIEKKLGGQLDWPDYTTEDLLLHYGHASGKIVFMVTDKRLQPLHRVSMTKAQWSTVVAEMPAIADNESRTLLDHRQII